LGGGLGGFGGGRSAASRARYAEGGYGARGYGRTGGGGIGGAGFGGAMPADTGARDATLPTGYGQRLTLHQAGQLNQKQNLPTYRFGVSPGGDRLQNEVAQPASPAPEQVLFFFHVVDTPLVKSALQRGGSESASTGAVRPAGPEAAQQSGRAIEPVPAPAAPGNSPK
jgi:hypothetical protein